MSETETKKYLVTPVKNRFIPDIVKNGRIQEPGVYNLNKREVRRVSNYGYMVTVIDPDPSADEFLFRIGINEIGSARVC